MASSRSPAVKRIMQEIREIEREGGDEVVAEALEDDLFEWFFAIKGAPGTDFAGGVYVGRIMLPAEYPLKPPSFVMLTPSGRFATGVKICLSISQFHEELWSPSWSVRTALVALAAFMPTPGGGAIGALDWAPHERRSLAAASRARPPPAGGGADRQAVVDRLHARLVGAAEKDVAGGGKGEEAEEVGEAGGSGAGGGEAGGEAAGTAATASPEEVAPPSPPPAAPPAAATEVPTLRQRAAAAAPTTTLAATIRPAAPPPPQPSTDWEDALLAGAAAVLACVLAVLLLRSALRAWGGGGGGSGSSAAAAAAANSLF